MRLVVFFGLAVLVAAPAFANAAIYLKYGGIKGDLTVGTTMELDGSQSPPNLTAKAYSWVQVSGPKVEIKNADKRNATFVPTSAGTYVFQLTMTDAAGASSVAQHVEFVIGSGGSAELGSGSGWGGIESISPSPAAPKKSQTGTTKSEGRKDSSVVAADNKKDTALSNGIRASAMEVRGWDPEKKEEFMKTVKTHAQVKSGQDLENFAKGILLKDENVEEVRADDGGVTVKYKGKGKLFGFIPITFTQEVTIDADAPGLEQVKVKFPWFAFLMKLDVTAQEMKAEIDAGSEKWLRGNSGWSYVEAAGAVDAVVNVLNK